MNPNLRFFRAVLATGAGMFLWSVITLAAMHGGVLLAEATR
jgi:hypothetical protein